MPRIDLKDKVVVITGSLRPLTRNEAVAFLTERGAIVQGYVSAQTQILVAGHKQLDLFKPDRRSKKYEAVLKRLEQAFELSFTLGLSMIKEKKI